MTAGSISSGFRSTVTLFVYGSALNRHKPVKSGFPDWRGAAAFKLGFPAAVRGRPGVFNVIHCDSAVPAASVTAAAAIITVGKRDIGPFLPATPQNDLLSRPPTITLH